MRRLAHPALVPFALFAIWMAMLAQAHAAPLTVRAHQANLYDGKLAIARVCVDLKVVKAERVELYVNGIGGGLPAVDGFPPIDGWEQWKGELRHYYLKPGHRHFCRSFDVEHLVFDTVPDRPGLPRSRWNTYKPTVVQSVYAELTVGQRRPVGLAVGVVDSRPGVG